MRQKLRRLLKRECDWWIAPLGDQALLVSLPDEATAHRLASEIRTNAPPWLVDVVQAFLTVAVYFDHAQVRFAEAAHWIRTSVNVDSGSREVEPSRPHRIPCCYELNLDLERIALRSGLSADEVIFHHLGTEYTVYAIGFCPGFPYLGYLPAPISGVPRLDTPRQHVEPGNVGLTGRQTGIYTENRPGGWNIIGRTPLELVHVEDGYFPLRTGDCVRFDRIDEREFSRLRGERLSTGHS